MTSDNPHPPAGWYTAPHAGGELRYWDGGRWLEDVPPPRVPPLQRGQKDKPRRGWLAGTLAVLGLGATVAGVVLAWVTWVNPNPSEQLSSTEERLPYIAQVDGLCSAFLTEFGELASASDPASVHDPVAARESMETVTGLYADLLSEWRQLTPPRETDMSLIRPAQDGLESMIMAFEEGIRHLDRTLNGADAAEDLRRALDDSNTHAQEFRRLTREYGFEVCPQLGT